MIEQLHAVLAARCLPAAATERFRSAAGNGGGARQARPDHNVQLHIKSVVGPLRYRTVLLPIIAWHTMHLQHTCLSARRRARRPTSPSPRTINLV